MKKILSLILVLSIFAFAQTSVLAQTATPLSASPSATTPVEISPLESPLSTTAALITPSPTSKIERQTFSKILSSMPKASFVVLIFVFAVLLIELFLLISKKGDLEKIPKVTPEAVMSEPENNKKNKTWLSLLILILLLVAIPLTLVLVRQRQEVRKKASDEGTAGGACINGNTCNDGLYCANNVCNMKIGDDGPGGCCDAQGVQGGGSCRSNEMCDITNGACLSGYSCRSLGGCSTDSDCGSNNKCISNTCVDQGAGGANIVCSVEGNSVKFTNTGGQTGSKQVSGDWCLSTRDTRAQCEAANNNYECRNSGQKTIDSGVLAAGESKTVNVVSINCGIWQIDFAGCNPNSSKGCSWNDSSCASVQPTTPPTTPPTPQPTTQPTTPPTAAPSSIPTSTPTTPPSNPSSTPAPTNAPNALSCNQGPCNDQNNTCASGLVCVHDTWFGHDQWVCRNNDCQIESDCICKQAENPPGPTNPPVGGPGQTARPYIPPVAGQTILSTPAPTIKVPVIPVAGIDGPTLATVFVGALLLIAGLALAL